MAVFTKFGFHVEFWIWLLLLTKWGYLPSIIYAIYVITLPFRFRSHPLFSASPPFLSSFMDILLAILLPPLGVFRKFGCHLEFWIYLLMLPIWGYLRSIIYAIYVITLPLRFHSHPVFSASPPFASSSQQRHSPCPLRNAFDAIAPKSDVGASSSKKPCHDVFINHHGKDAKHKIASTIYNMLGLMGVQAFLDRDEFKKGDFFPRQIEEAMRSASVHIAILSPRYAESPWCLEELSFMLQIDVAIIPVFYGVSPSDIRCVAKKGKCADAFRRLKDKRSDLSGEPRYSPEKIKEWEEALKKASYLNGTVILDVNECDEGKLSREIVETALVKMKKVPLEVATFPVGLDEATEEFERKVGSSTGNENVRVVGIVGMRGAGKTTLAKAVFNRKCSSVSRSSFLPNVRDAASTNTLHELQKNLLQDLRICHPSFHNTDEGTGILARREISASVLIVLDNVDHIDQMRALLPLEMLRNLGRGSLIIVTTRDKKFLTSWGHSSIYHMKLLSPSNAKQLFCRHAFSDQFSQHGFEHLIDRCVEACNGLPLSLKLLGGKLKGESEAYWEDQLIASLPLQLWKIALNWRSCLTSLLGSLCELSTSTYLEIHQS